MKKINSFAVGLGMSAAAHANPQALGVWDSQGTFVGNYAGEPYVEMVFKGVPTRLTFGRKGLVPGSTLYYKEPGCHGQGYFLADSPPPVGALILGVVYHPGPVTTFTAQSYWSGTDTTGSCTPDIVPGDFGPAITTGPLPTIEPPLCVSATRMQCR